MKAFSPIRMIAAAIFLLAAILSEGITPLMETERSFLSEIIEQAA